MFPDKKLTILDQKCNWSSDCIKCSFCDKYYFMHVRVKISFTIGFIVHFCTLSRSYFCFSQWFFEFSVKLCLCCHKTCYHAHTWPLKRYPKQEILTPKRRPFSRNFVQQNYPLSHLKNTCLTFVAKSTNMLLMFIASTNTV